MAASISAPPAPRRTSSPWPGRARSCCDKRRPRVSTPAPWPNSPGPCPWRLPSQLHLRLVELLRLGQGERVVVVISGVLGFQLQRLGPILQALAHGGFHLSSDLRGGEPHVGVGELRPNHVLLGVNLAG